MKFSIVTIAGALASANAATIRGDAALKKLAVMQKFTNSVNKKSFGATRRRRLDQNQNNQEDQYQENEEVTAETVLQPYVCTTAKSSGGLVSYISFIDGGGAEYITTLSSYLEAIGESYAEELANLCNECDLFEDYCDLDEEERQSFANMSEEEFEEYMQQQKQKQQNDRQKNEEDKDTAYAAYSYGHGGRSRFLYGDVSTLCGSCEMMCDDANEEMSEMYEGLMSLFGESMCTQAGDGVNYVGHTCGSDGMSIELAMFTDEDCLNMSDTQNAYSFYQQAVAASYNADADGDGVQDYTYVEHLGEAYMYMVTNLMGNEFSCSMGTVRDFDGSDPSEACANLFENSISKTDCLGDNNNNNYNNNYYYNTYNNYNNNNRNLEDYDMDYSEDLEDVCGKVLELEQNLLGNSWYNPYTGISFTSLFPNLFEKNFNTPLSAGAIAGIVVGAVAVAAAVAAVVVSKNKKKSDLEEPVFQGGALN